MSNNEKEFMADIESLSHPEKNVRIHNEKQINELKRSLEKFGQIRPAVIDEDNVILVGNGLIQALREMGEEQVKVLRKTGMTENEKKKLMLADNKIYDLGLDDIDTIYDFINELSDDLDIPGFDEEVLQSLVIDEEEITERVSDYGTLDPEDIEQRQRVSSEEGGLGDWDEPAVSGPESPGDEAPEEGEVITCPHCGEYIWL